MSTAENKATVRRSIEEPINHGNLFVLKDVYARDVVIHDPVNPDVADLASTRTFVAELRMAYPDAAVTIEDQIGEGDRVVTRWTFRGTNSGPFSASGLTGKPVTVTGITISRLRDGAIVEEWVEWDAAGLTRQLDLPLG